MFFGADQPSAYDWNFRIYNYAIRVSWSFWLGALVLGSMYSGGVVSAYQSTPIIGVLIAWIAAEFVSILVHELGHAFAFQQTGIRSQIVLHALGGYAQPLAYGGGRLNDRWQVWIAFAGPLFQFVSGFAVLLIVRSLGYSVPFGSVFGLFPWASGGQPIENGLLFAMINFYVGISMFWAVINLVPVFPLDGGRIVKHGVPLLGGTRQQANQAVVIGGVASAIVLFMIN
ncbi:MAG: site-2 protease family protein, partial [Planctomycetota bacterium]